LFVLIKTRNNLYSPDREKGDIDNFSLNSRYHKTIHAKFYLSTYLHITSANLGLITARNRKIARLGDRHLYTGKILG
jgi:hypothetical protein